MGCQIDSYVLNWQLKILLKKGGGIHVELFNCISGFKRKNTHTIGQIDPYVIIGFSLTFPNENTVIIMVKVKTTKKYISEWKCRHMNAFIYTKEKN